MKSMLKKLGQYALPATVFITGACVLIVEIVATRVLSPYYGNTIFTVSSVISVILAALSVGYYVGGVFADRHPSMRWFFSVILLSGLALLLFHIVGMIALPIFGYAFTVSMGPLITSILLFFLPAFLLGTLSPYAVKLQSENFPGQGIGSAAGKIFFWSTLGSIVGSLLAGFVLIPLFGVDRIMIANGVVLFLLGLIPLLLLGEKKYLSRYVVTMVVLVGVFASMVSGTQGGVVYSRDGIYEKMTVYDGELAGRPIRFFKQDHSGSGAMFLDSNDPKDLVYDYTKYYSLYKIFNTKVEKALVIGGGAYSIPKALRADLPNATIDVAEIEPALYELAKKYFGVSDDQKIRNHIEDGRRILHDSRENYDLIFSDVYYSLFSIPAHFTTKEFFTIAKDKLNKDGVFIANMIGDLSRQQPSLIMSEIKTFREVFPNSYFFAVDDPGITQSQNIVFVGYNGDRDIDLNAVAVISDPDPIIRSLRDKAIDINRFELSPYAIMTDNHAPVEYLTGQVLQRTSGQRDLFDGREMLAVVDQQLRYGPRHPTAPGHAKVRDFIEAEMKELTPVVKKQVWEHVESGGGSYELTNIIAQLYPEKEKRIILATHYDSLKKSFNDSRKKTEASLGANNSASGVAVLVELARILSNSHAVPNVGVDIVFFDGEEGEEFQAGDFTNWEPLGSTYFAQHLEEVYKGNKPESGIVLDMVCDKDLRIPKERSSVINAPVQTKKFWDIASEIDGDVFVDQIGQEIRDDHTPLNRVGIPSVLVIDYDYPAYATTNDTLDKCSGDSLRTVAEAIWNYIYIGV